MPTTVLVVDDEFFIRFTIAEFLRVDGFEVLEAVDAEAALQILRDGAHVDLMFTDIRMPGAADGCVLAERVKAEWPETKIVLTSGYAPELLTARRAVGDMIISKPYRPQAVLSAIRSVLSNCAANA